MLNKSNTMKIIGFFHVLLMILISSVVITAIFNTTLFSKANLIETIDYALDVTGAIMSPVDSLLVARIIRQQLWQVHFFVGVSLPIMAAIIYLMRQQIYKTKQITVFLNVSILFYMSLVGSLLNFRRELNLSLDFANILRDLHWTGIYIFIAFVLYHLYIVLIKTKRGY